MADEFIIPVRSYDEELPKELVEQMLAQKPPLATDAFVNLSQTPRNLTADTQIPMDNTNKNFKGQQRNEVVLSFTRKHWIVLLPHFIGFGIFLTLLFTFFAFISREGVAGFLSQFGYRIISGIAILGLTFYLHRFFGRFFNYYLQIFIITNFRVLHLDQTLYFTRNRDSIDIPEIQDILIQQKGVLKTILNYGEIIITLSSAHATKTLLCIPNPEYFFRKINKTKREYITSRRLTKATGYEEVSHA